MIKAVCIEIGAYTASFRVPHLHGHQLTLDVPPPSTIFGLLSAAKGEWVLPGEGLPWIAYCLTYEGKGEDLETIIAYDRGRPLFKRGEIVRNIFRREFLLNPRLTLYLPERPWVGSFQRPRFPLVLGRSQDVAYVLRIREAVNLEPVNEGEVSGVLLPYRLVFGSGTPALIYNLPVAFESPYQRRLLGMKIFGIIREPWTVKGKNFLVRDGQTGRVIPRYTHEWLLSED